MAEGVQSSGCDCESGSDISLPPPPPPKIPNVIANWWLNENLGSGYSGAWAIFSLTIMDVTYQGRL